MGGSRWRAALAAGLLVSGAVASPADAKVKANKEFRFPSGQPARILVFRPDVQVGSMGVGGMDEANADWTKAARENLTAQLDANQRVTGNEVIFLPEQEGHEIENSPVPPVGAAELLALVADGTLSGSLAKQMFEAMLETGEGAAT